MSRLFCCRRLDLPVTAGSGDARAPGGARARSGTATGYSVTVSVLEQFEVLPVSHTW